MTPDPRINPRVEPSARAIEIATEVAADGGSLTAEEWEFGQRYELVGIDHDQARALRDAGPDGAITGRPGDWTIFKARRR